MRTFLTDENIKGRSLSDLITISAYLKFFACSPDDLPDKLANTLYQKLRSLPEADRESLNWNELARIELPDDQPNITRLYNLIEKFVIENFHRVTPSVHVIRASIKRGVTENTTHVLSDPNEDFRSMSSDRLAFQVAYDILHCEEDLNGAYFKAVSEQLLRMDNSDLLFILTSLDEHLNVRPPDGATVQFILACHKHFMQTNSPVSDKITLEDFSERLSCRKMLYCCLENIASESDLIELCDIKNIPEGELSLKIEELLVNFCGAAKHCSGDLVDRLVTSVTQHPVTSSSEVQNNRFLSLLHMFEHLREDRPLLLSKHRNQLKVEALKQFELARKGGEYTLCLDLMHGLATLDIYARREMKFLVKNSKLLTEFMAKNVSEASDVRRKLASIGIYRYNQDIYRMYASGFGYAFVFFGICALLGRWSGMDGVSREVVAPPTTAVLGVDGKPEFESRGVKERMKYIFSS